RRGRADPVRGRYRPVFLFGLLCRPGQLTIRDAQGEQVVEDELQLIQVGNIQLHVLPVHHPGEDPGDDVGIAGGGGVVAGVNVLKAALRIQAARRADVDVPPGGEDALVGAGDGQVGAAGVLLDVVGAVIADQADGDDGPHRADAAADRDVAEDAVP